MSNNSYICYTANTIMTADKTQKRPYSIEPYDPNWVVKFNEIKKVLTGIFGEKALTIEHIGSTSIPGMSAKPLVDVLIIVENMEPYLHEKELMEQAGYQWAENYIGPNTIVFWKSDADERKTENIHVCVKNSPKANQFINTRDYVRAHPDRAQAYSELKKRLKEQFPNDYPAYRAGKQAFLDETERLTREWLELK